MQRVKEILQSILQLLKELAQANYHDPLVTKPEDLAMNKLPPTPPGPVPGYFWDTPVNARHSVRVICDEEGLTVEQKNTMCATIGGESGWHVDAIGKPNFDGSCDYGICQINTKYWIGQGKQFPTTDYVLTHPEECVRWMCKQWKMGYRNWWYSYKNGRYLQFM